MSGHKFVIAVLVILFGFISLQSEAEDKSQAESNSTNNDRADDKEMRLLLFEAGGASPTGEKHPEQVSAMEVAEAKAPRYHSLSPAMAMKMRNPASLTYPDGITGPHSDLWRKIRSRYATENLTTSSP